MNPHVTPPSIANSRGLSFRLARRDRSCRSLLPCFAFVLLACLLVATRSAAAGITFNFTLSAACTTSAAVYDSSGQLVKTLWRKTAYTAGAQSALWDGTKDDGTVAASGTYRIKVLTNNVSYVWEGTIGNTDTAFTNSTTTTAIWHGYDVINDMAINGSNMFIANGYAEGNSNAFRALTSAPNTPKPMVWNGNVIDTAIAFRYTATDGVRTYFAATPNGYSNASCVLAYNVSNNSPATFTYGVSYKPTSWSMTYPSVIDFTPAGPGNTAVQPPRGLAVQQTGNLLAVSHSSGANEVRLFDKTTGQLYGSITVTTPGMLAFSPTTNDLWVISSGTTVQCFTAAQLASVTASGTILTPAATISGVVKPLSVAVDPRSGVDLVLVVDGGASQQVKGFTSAGAIAPGWSTPLGVAGGYNAANGSAITTSKYWFKGQTFIAIQSDGSFWLADPGNRRVLHFSSARAYLEQIAFLPAAYAIAVDVNSPTRVFGDGWLEYEIDYTKPLLPGDPTAAGGNNSWKLVRNWATEVPDDYLDIDLKEGIITVATLSNGRTYAFVYNKTTNLWDVAELTSAGLLRFTGISHPSGASFYPNGDVRRHTYGGGMQTIMQRRLTGFDAAGNPKWGAETPLAQSSSGSQTPAYKGAFAGSAGPQFPVTSSNVVISFDQSVTIGSTNPNAGMHLGGIQVGGTSWFWQGSPAVTTNDFFNPAKQNGSYVIGDSTNYGGNKVLSEGRHVIYGYHGEGWKGQQANQFVHFYDDGLFVGQFGVPNANTTALAGVAGNSFNSNIVKVNGTYYFYHGDESNHAGIHRWRLDGMDTIAEMAGTGAFSGGSSTITLTTLANPPTNLAAVAVSGQVSLSWTASTGATSYDIYRGTEPSGQGTTPVYTGVTGTTKTDTGLVNGTTYYYKVVAVNAGGSGGFSDEVAAMPAIIKDNADATGIVKTGSWTTLTSGATVRFGPDYLTDDNTAKGTKSVRFTPTLPTAGIYEVFAWWVANPNRATNVPYDITHSGGTTTVSVNQQVNGAQWRSLGVYNFAAGTTGNVLVRTTGTNGYVIADAVRFVEVSPVVIVDDADIADVTVTGSWITATTASGYYGVGYLHDGNTAQGTKSVRFTPNLPVAGTYEVYARWTAGSNRADNVSVAITHSGGTSNVVVNQKLNGSVWMLLGTHTFNAGTGGYLTIFNTGANGHVIADAVRFVKQP